MSPEAPAQPHPQESFRDSLEAQLAAPLSPETYDALQAAVGEIREDGAGRPIGPDGKQLKRSLVAEAQHAADPDLYTLDGTQRSGLEQIIAASDHTALPADVRQRATPSFKQSLGIAKIEMARLRKEAEGRLALADHITVQREVAAAAEESRRADLMQAERNRAHDRVVSDRLDAAAPAIEAAVDEAMAQHRVVGKGAGKLVRAKVEREVRGQVAAAVEPKAQAAADARQAYIDAHGGADKIESINWQDEHGFGARNQTRAPQPLPSETRIIDNRSTGSAQERPEGIPWRQWHEADTRTRAQLINEPAQQAVRAAAVENVRRAAAMHGASSPEATAALAQAGEHLDPQELYGLVDAANRERDTAHVLDTPVAEIDPRDLVDRLDLGDLAGAIAQRRQSDAQAGTAEPRYGLRAAAPPAPAGRHGHRRLDLGDSPWGREAGANWSAAEPAGAAAPGDGAIPVPPAVDLRDVRDLWPAEPLIGEGASGATRRMPGPDGAQLLRSSSTEAGQPAGTDPDSAPGVDNDPNGGWGSADWLPDNSADADPWRGVADPYVADTTPDAQLLPLPAAVPATTGRSGPEQAPDDTRVLNEAERVEAEREAAVERARQLRADARAVWDDLSPEDKHFIAAGEAWSGDYQPARLVRSRQGRRQERRALGMTRKQWREARNKGTRYVPYPNEEIDHFYELMPADVRARGAQAEVLEELRNRGRRWIMGGDQTEAEAQTQRRSLNLNRPQTRTQGIGYIAGMGLDATSLAASEIASGLAGRRPNMAPGQTELSPAYKAGTIPAIGFDALMLAGVEFGRGFTNKAADVDPSDPDARPSRAYRLGRSLSGGAADHQQSPATGGNPPNNNP